MTQITVKASEETLGLCHLVSGMKLLSCPRSHRKKKCHIQFNTYVYSEKNMLEKNRWWYISLKKMKKGECLVQTQWKIKGFGRQ